jgi:ABC-type glycerol-3-phosphate transport system permease component
MSQQLAICLIAVAANLVGMLVIYSVMAHLLARLAWRGRGIFGVIVMIVAAQVFWIALALLIVRAREPDNSAAYALWFGNWLVSGFGVVVLRQRVGAIPRQLEDAARLDGLGLVGTWRHIVFPFVRLELGLIVLFTVMATLLPFWAFINLPDFSNVIVLYQRFFSLEGRIVMMAAGSLIGALPLVAIFFLAKRRGLPLPA